MSGRAITIGGHMTEYLPAVTVSTYRYCVGQHRPVGRPGSSARRAIISLPRGWWWPRALDRWCWKWWWRW